jgi:hypothetical protein
MHVKDQQIRVAYLICARQGLFSFTAHMWASHIARIFEIKKLAALTACSHAGTAYISLLHIGACSGS